jgi:hypothetical protein
MGDGKAWKATGAESGMMAAKSLGKARTWRFDLEKMPVFG